MFGREAAKILDYVECFPDGYRKGIKIAKACADVKIEGFPTWVINGQASNPHIYIFSFDHPKRTQFLSYKYVCNCFTMIKPCQQLNMVFCLTSLMNIICSYVL